MQILFADQLGPHFTLDGEEQLLLEVKSQFRKRRYHRQKAHLILSALRHRAELGAEILEIESYRDFRPRPDTRVVAPTSRPMRALVASWGVGVEPARGFVCSESDFAGWFGAQKGRLRLEEFYRWQRQRTGILMEASSGGNDPVGGRWNFDAENRLPPPKTADLGVVDPWWPTEDEIDERVRWDLDALARDGVQFLGEDGPRLFAVTHSEAKLALDHFIGQRLKTFGAHEDAMMSGDWAMSHSLLSVPMNLGILDPLEVARSAEAQLDLGASIESVEGFIRQVIGWRDYVWHLYWVFGEDYLASNSLTATNPLPDTWLNLEAKQIEAACVSQAISDVSKRGWLHHIQRLMLLANQAAQRGYRPQQVNEWFVDAFVDGTPWVMPANVIGMGLFADGGRMSTKPYVSGGAYISRMSNYCGDCPFNPKIRVGDNSCPFTAGYWSFLDRNRHQFDSNHRMFQPMAGLRRLSDVDEIRTQESERTRL